MKSNVKPKDTHTPHEETNFWERRMEGKYLRNWLQSLEGTDCRIPEKSKAWQLAPGMQLGYLDRKKFQVEVHLQWADVTEQY